MRQSFDKSPFITLVGQCMRYMEVVYKGSLKWDKDISSCVSLT